MLEEIKEVICFHSASGREFLLFNHFKHTTNLQHIFKNTRQKEETSSYKEVLLLDRFENIIAKGEMPIIIHYF